MAIFTRTQLDNIGRKELQKFAKEHNIKANLSNDAIREKLLEIGSPTPTKRVPSQSTVVNEPKVEPSSSAPSPITVVPPGVATPTLSQLTTPVETTFSRSPAPSPYIPEGFNPRIVTPQASLDLGHDLAPLRHPTQGGPRPSLLRLRPPTLAGPVLSGAAVTPSPASAEDDRLKMPPPRSPPHHPPSPTSPSPSRMPRGIPAFRASPTPSVAASDATADSNKENGQPTAHSNEYNMGADQGPRPGSSQEADGNDSDAEDEEITPRQDKGKGRYRDFSELKGCFGSCFGKQETGQSSPRKEPSKPLAKPPTFYVDGDGMTTLNPEAERFREFASQNIPTPSQHHTATGESSTRREDEPIVPEHEANGHYKESDYASPNRGFPPRSQRTENSSLAGNASSRGTHIYAPPESPDFDVRASKKDVKKFVKKMRSLQKEVNKTRDELRKLDPKTIRMARKAALVRRRVNQELSATRQHEMYVAYAQKQGKEWMEEHLWHGGVDVVKDPMTGKFGERSGEYLQDIVHEEDEDEDDDDDDEGGDDDDENGGGEDGGNDGPDGAGGGYNSNNDGDGPDVSSNDASRGNYARGGQGAPTGTGPSGHGGQTRPTSNGAPTSQLEAEPDLGLEFPDATLRFLRRWAGGRDREESRNEASNTAHASAQDNAPPAPEDPQHPLVQLFALLKSLKESIANIHASVETNASQDEDAHRLMTLLVEIATVYGRETSAPHRKNPTLYDFASSIQLAVYQVGLDALMARLVDKLPQVPTFALPSRGNLLEALTDAVHTLHSLSRDIGRRPSAAMHGPHSSGMPSATPGPSSQPYPSAPSTSANPVPLFPSTQTSTHPTWIAGPSNFPIPQPPSTSYGTDPSSFMPCPAATAYDTSTPGWSRHPPTLQDFLHQSTLEGVRRRQQLAAANQDNSWSLPSQPRLTGSTPFSSALPAGWGETNRGTKRTHADVEDSAVPSQGQVAPAPKRQRVEELHQPRPPAPAPRPVVIPLDGLFNDIMRVTRATPGGERLSARIEEVHEPSEAQEQADEMRVESLLRPSRPDRNTRR